MNRVILLILAAILMFPIISGADDEISIGGVGGTHVIPLNEGVELSVGPFFDFIGPGVNATSDSMTIFINHTENSALDVQLSGNSVCTNASCDSITFSNDFAVSESSLSTASVSLVNITIDTVTMSGDTIDDFAQQTGMSNADSSNTDSDSGLEVVDNSLVLLRGCADNEILKWDETNDDWNCEADDSSAGGGDIERVGDCVTGECLVTGGNTTHDTVTISGTLTAGITTVTGLAALIVNNTGESVIRIQDTTASEFAILKQLDTDREFVISRSGTGGSDLTIDRLGDVVIGLQGDTTITNTIFVGVGLDAVGAADLDIGSADVTDITNTTDSGTVIIDGSISTSGGSTQAGRVIILEDTDDGTNSTTIIGVATSADLEWILPASNGTAGQILEIASVSSNTLTLEWDADGGGSTTFAWTMRPQQAKLPANNPMGIDAGNIRWRGLLDDTTEEAATWDTVLFPYQGGTLQGKIFYTLVTTSSSDIAAFDLRIECKSDGDASFDVDSFGTINSIDSPSQSLTAGTLDVLTDTSLNEDSCAEYDHITVVISRDVASDGVTGDVELRKVTIEEL